ncbi:RidA family protein [Georhizobium profundi]|uniref:RidA family protein n=1 Tax=Georhizobium profundi TaxID=2341112 RepID=A0A3S9B9D4_9HYPH|nr:RidA family protein [Georhizobium profundi]AZN73454.1 RidA family protein [Georhizobium profundi]
MSVTTLHPEGWAPAKGYANGMKATGTMIFVGGQIGWTADQVFETDDFVGQCEQALKNIRAVLEEGGAGPEHLVRLTWFVTDKQQYLAGLKDLGRVYRDVMGRNFPAMTMVQVTALVEDRAKVEIEATAVL